MIYLVWAFDYHLGPIVILATDDKGKAIHKRDNLGSHYLTNGWIEVWKDGKCLGGLTNIS